MKIKKGVIILGVLAAAMVLMWMFVLGIIPFKKSGKPIPRKLTTVKVSPEELKKKAEETAVSFSNWLKEQEEIQKMLVYHKVQRDPLAPVAKKAAQTKKVTPIKLPPMSLKGIAWDKIQPMALINDLIVKKGDTIKGAKIVKIDFNRVTVLYRSRKFVIKLIQ